MTTSDRPILGHSASRRESHVDSAAQRSSRDVMGYQPPTGPIGIMGHNRPGLGGPNSNVGTQGQRFGPSDGARGSAGLGGRNLGNCGTQGSH
jgi:hypothetical protein